MAGMQAIGDTKAASESVSLGLGPPCAVFTQYRGSCHKHLTFLQV